MTSVAIHCRLVEWTRLFHCLFSPAPHALCLSLLSTYQSVTLKKKKNGEKTFRLVAHYLGFKSTAEINPIILTLKNSVLNRPISSA